MELKYIHKYLEVILLAPLIMELNGLPLGAYVVFLISPACSWTVRACVFQSRALHTPVFKGACVRALSTQCPVQALCLAPHRPLFTRRRERCAAPRRYGGAKWQ